MPNQKARWFRQRSTDAERWMWAALRGRRLINYKFGRQHPIDPYIVDFACTEHGLAIEIDGGQHAETAANQKRAVWLESHGWRVIRFWNNDVLGNINGVVLTVLQALQNA